MRILFITPRFYPEIGGVEKHTLSVANELAKRVNTIQIITCSNKTNLALQEHINKLEIHRIFSNKKSGNFLTKLSNTWVYFLKNVRLLLQADRIHLHDYETFLWVLPFVAFIRKRLFITFHGYEGYPVPKAAWLIRRIAENLVCENICVGTFIAKWYGTKCQHFTIGAVERSTSLISPEKDEGVFIGRLEPDTGIMELIKALSILKSEYGLELPFHICGDGSLKKKLIDISNENNLTLFMHGFVTDPQKYMLSPRYSFVTGYLSILDAMISKKIVLSIYSNPLKMDYLYSIPKVEKMMFIASSPSQLAKNLKMIMARPEIGQSMIERAYRFAEEQTWAKAAEMYLEVYGAKSKFNH